MDELARQRIRLFKEIQGEGRAHEEGTGRSWYVEAGEVETPNGEVVAGLLERQLSDGSTLVERFDGRGKRVSWEVKFDPNLWRKR